MSKAINDIQAELTIAINNIAEICDRYKYDVVPSLLLRHRKGFRSSMLLSNDDPDLICETISNLAAAGPDQRTMSAHEAAMSLLMNQPSERGTG